MRVLHDGGGGATDISLEYFRLYKGALTQVSEINIDANREFCMEIQSGDVIMLLSGVSAGYNGTGSRASQQVLKELGVTDSAILTTVLLKKQVRIDMRRPKPCIVPL